MRKHFTIIFLALLCANAMAYDFSAVCSTGQTLYYNITSNVEPYTVEVTSELDGGYNTYPTGDLEIPESVEYNSITYSVTSIGDEAFGWCSGLTSVIIGNSVTNISYHAFYACYGLTGELTIPNSITSIGEGAFVECSGLTELTIGNSVTFIGLEAFMSCVGLTSITIPSSVESIDLNPFLACSGLETIIVNSDNPYYDSRDNCNAIISADGTLVSGCKNTIIPNTVTSIGIYAFGSCTDLTSVTIPNSVEIIGNYAFDKCSGLTSVTIGNSVTTIEQGAFDFCIGLTSIIIPSSVQSITLNPFLECSGLETIIVNSDNPYYDSRDNCNAIISADGTLVTGCKNTIIPNTVTSIGTGAFSGCYGLTSVTIPNSVTNIDIDAFSHCTGLTEVTIPNSVTSIGTGAFRVCNSLNSVTIGSSVETIGDGTFESCENIANIYTLANTPPTIDNSNAFTSTAYTTATLWTPCGLADTYRNATNWSNFTNISEHFQYTLNVLSSNEQYGTASIRQQPDCTDNIAVIEATPNQDYRFVSWNDGNAENPRTITVTSDSTFVANFIRDGNYPQIVDFEELLLDGENSSWIGDDGSGQFTSSYLTLYNDYESQYDTWTGFAYTNGTDMETNTWTNLSSCVGHGAGNSANYATAYIGLDWMNDYSPIPVGIKIDTEHSGSFTNRGAYFCMPVLLSKYVIGTDNHYASNQFYFKLQVRAYANDNLIGNREIMMADFTEGNSYMMDDWTYVDLSWLENADSLNFIAISNDTSGGYGINAPLFFCMDNFGADAPVFYTIIATAGENGTITPNGEVSIGEGRSPTFTIIANEGYRISSVMVDDVDVTVELVDGVYTFENVSADHTIDASFEEIPTFTITVLSNNESYGSVSGDGTYDEGTQVVITATPYEGYQFVQWDDGNAENPRTITVTSDSTFIALFEEVPSYTITVLSNNDSYGSVSGGGTYYEGDIATLTAMPYDGYCFTSWDDDNTDNPRTITVSSDSTFIANFSEHILFTIDTTVNNFVTVGDHTFYSTGNYTFSMPSETGCDTIYDLQLRVLAEPVYDIAPNPTSKMLNINSDGFISHVEFYSTTGQLVMRKEVNGNFAECDVESLVSGIYIVRIYGEESNLPSVYKVVKE